MGLAGAVVGVVALIQIRANPQQLAGKGLAILGIVTSIASFGLMALMMAIGLALEAAP